MIKKYLLKIAVILLPFSIFSQTASQLTVTPNSVATQLAQAITGSGVTVSGASLNCGGLGYVGSGTFSYPASGTSFNLGLTNGIILTNGQASDAAQAAQILAIQTGNNFADPNLTSISPQAKFDNCILTFSFVPVCNQLSITSAFGSSEYDGFQCSSYNDAFGMFLTGPNPSGGNYTATNIATLPSGTPIAINNINDGSDGCPSASNPSYYQGNYNGTEIVYEGMTTAITSTAAVVPCSTYFLKIAIADAGDEVYDSGVFIGGNSVSCSTAPSASITSTPVSCGGSTGTASVSISNYTATPTYSWSPGGQTTPSLNGLTAGNYTCTVGFATACSVYAQTLITTVSTPSTFSLSTTSTPATCSGSSNGSATLTINGSTAPYNINWATTPTQTTSTISNLIPGTYSVVVQDNSGCTQATTINVGITTPTFLTYTTTSVCGNNAALSANVGSSYQWYDTLNNIIPGATMQTYTATNVLNNQQYIVSYHDNTTGCRDSMEITISKVPLTFNYNTSNACHGGNNGSISLNPTGTYTSSSYNWNITGGSIASGTTTTTPISIDSLGAGNYTVSVNPTGNSSCLYIYTVQVVQNVIPAPAFDTTKVCNLDTVQLNPPVLAGSTNNWYTSSSVFLGSSAANMTYSLLPNPYQVNNSNFTDTIKTAAGCVSVYKMNIILQSFQDAISILEQLKCYNDSIGKVKISVPRETNGPIGKPFTFNWVYPSPYTSPAIINAGSTLPVSSIETNLHAGYYYCVIKSGNCTDTAKVTIINPPKLPTDSIYAYYCPKDSLALLIAANSGNTNYVWHPSNSGASVTGDSINVPVPNINSYYVTYTSSSCPDTAKIIIPITTHNVFAPNELANIFSPNGDNKNDFFYPFYQKGMSQDEIGRQSNVNVYSLKVYDRWGTLMYEATDYTKPWDGKTKGGRDADDGTYFYVVKYESNCATNADLETKKGFVELMR